MVLLSNHLQHLESGDEGTGGNENVGSGVGDTLSWISGCFEAGAEGKLTMLTSTTVGVAEAAELVAASAAEVGTTTVVWPEGTTGAVVS